MAPKAKKSRFISPRFTLPLAAVVGLIASFVVYYFVIIKQREALLDGRAFRSLAAVSMQFRDLVNTYGNVFQDAAREHGDQPEKVKAVTALTKSAPFTKRLDSQKTTASAGKSAPAQKTPDILSFLAAQGSQLADVDECQSSPDAELLLSPQGRGRTTANAVPRSNGYNLELASNGLCAHVPFETALSPLVTEAMSDVFDERHSC